MKYPTKVDIDQKAHDAEFAAARERGFQDIFREYEIIPRNVANENGVEELCGKFLSVQVGEIAPDLATFRSVVEEDQSILKGKHRISIEPVAQQKLKILGDIEKLLTPVMSSLDLRSELKKLSFWSLEQVQARKQQIIERQRLSKLSSTAIKQELAANRPKLNRYHPYEELPEMTASDLKAVLRSYKSNSYLRRYGAEQLNDKLFGRI